MVGNVVEEIYVASYYVETLRAPIVSMFNVQC